MKLLDLFNLACSSGDKTAGNETQYTIHKTKDAIYLAIQGSVQKQDWLYNFDFAVRPYRDMEAKWYAHRGFATAWKLARDQITKDVISMLGNKKLVILGYSHGAALAMLAHEWFVFNGYAPEAYCFGCPRVLWLPSKKIKQRFTNVHIIRRRGDLVTHVPFAFMGYRFPVKIKSVGKRAPIWWKRHLIAEYGEALA